MTRLRAELDALGLLDEFNNPISNYAPTVVVNPIWAEAGIIDIRADQLAGSGHLEAPGDASVETHNNTSAFREIMGITIPETNGRRVSNR